MPKEYDVIVVGAGNAALSAAIAAKETCQSVLVVEKAPEYFRGGNTYFTGGIIRFAFDGLEDIKTVIPDMSPTEEESVEVGSYTEDQFYDDMMRVTQGLSDPDLAQILVSQSLPAMQWMALQGRPLRAVLWAAGLPGRGYRQVPLLGRAAGGGRGRRQGPVGPAVRRLPRRGHRRALLHPGHGAAPGPHGPGQRTAGAGAGGRLRTSTPAP